MDPLSQAALGVTYAQAFRKKAHDFSTVTIIGMLSGMAADLDSVIKSASDPLLQLEYHRQFSHSLIFIPFGGLFCAIILYFCGYKKKLSFKETYFYSTIGYATHALLDTCTTYGTQLLWPFSNQRFAWNTVSIIDPIYTFILIFLLILCYFKANIKYAYAAVFYSLFYMLIGLFQQNRAETIACQLAKERGHENVVCSAKPSFANILVWKNVYEYNNRYYIDAIRLGLKHKIYQGDSIEKLNIKRDLPWINEKAKSYNDIERFRWFSNSYVAIDPNNKYRIIDVRYSLVPNQIVPLWGITIDPNKQEHHVAFTQTRDNVKKRATLLWNMILGR